MIPARARTRGWDAGDDNMPAIGAFNSITSTTDIQVVATMCPETTLQGLSPYYLEL